MHPAIGGVPRVREFDNTDDRDTMKRPYKKRGDLLN